MTAITRRTVLASAGAAAVVAGVPGAVQGEDAALLAQLGQFPELHGRWTRMWEKAQSHRAAIEAMLECPDHSDYRARDAFLEGHDYLRYWDEAEKLSKPLGALVSAIFETPAQTVEGVLGKVRILHIARGDYDGEVDESLEAHQDDEDHPWFGSIIADLERLAQEARS